MVVAFEMRQLSPVLANVRCDSASSAEVNNKHEKHTHGPHRRSFFIADIERSQRKRYLGVLCILIFFILNFLTLYIVILHVYCVK